MLQKRLDPQYKQRLMCDMEPCPVLVVALTITARGGGLVESSSRVGLGENWMMRGGEGRPGRMGGFQAALPGGRRFSP